MAAFSQHTFLVSFLPESWGQVTDALLSFLKNLKNMMLRTAIKNLKSVFFGNFIHVCKAFGLVHSLLLPANFAWDPPTHLPQDSMSSLKMIVYINNPIEFCHC